MNLLELSANGLACLNALILFALLVFRRSNVLPNYALGGMMFIPAFYFFNSIIMLQGHGTEAYPLFFLGQFLAIFYTPFVCVYVYALLGKRINPLFPLFFISLLIGLIPIYLLIDYLQKSAAAQALFFEHITNGPYPESVTFYSIVFYTFQQGVFIYLLIQVRKIKKSSEYAFSNLDTIKLTYLQQFMTILVTLNFLIVLLYLVFDILFVEYILLPIIITTIYGFIVFYAFKNNTIFTDKNYQLHLKTLEESTQAEVPVSKKGVFIDDPLYKDIINTLERKEILTDHELSIGKLARELGHPIATVSKSINSSFNQNFFELINSKRISYAQELLSQNSNITIEAIAYDTGFNSRATFYRAFKKHTGITPSEYLAQLELN